jgi:hypothetical protein
MPSGYARVPPFQSDAALCLSLSGKQLQFQGTLPLASDSDEVAGQVSFIARGVVALLKLQTNNLESAAR